MDQPQSRSFHFSASSPVDLNHDGIDRFSLGQLRLPRQPYLGQLSSPKLLPRHLTDQYGAVSANLAPSTPSFSFHQVQSLILPSP